MTQSRPGTPGLAYDCLGRELLLAVGTALKAPERPAGAQWTASLATT